VSRHLEAVVQKEKVALSTILASTSNFTITTDAWTSQMTNDSYITVTCHYIDEEWRTRSVILATRATEERHPADNMRNFIRGVLEEYGANREDIVYVTDNASNMKAAFRGDLWVGCAGHNLNLVLSHGLQIGKESNEPSLPEEVSQLIGYCKELVTLAKRTRLNQVLDKTLKQCAVTRWNSVLTTMMSIADNSSDLRTYASEPGANKNVLRLVCSINEELLMQVIAVLKPFDSATKILSTDISASIHLVVPTKRQLQQHLTLVASRQ